VATTTSRFRYVLLLRGVNVGGHKKVPMADLKVMLAGLGFANVRTLLNSGNAVFDAPRPSPPERLASTIESAIERTFGFSSRSFVLTSEELDTVVTENTLAGGCDNPSRLMVAYYGSAADRGRVEPLTRQSWSPEALEVGSKAVYVWCPAGVLESELFDAVARSLKSGVTTRNWATTSKLQALCREG
jgi:uncharacterized protein (DUF1697 family)